MRSIFTAALLFLSATAQAAPAFEFFATHPKIGVLRGATAFVHNTSDETAHDVVVTIAWDERLKLYENRITATPNDGEPWSCEVSQRSASCRVAEFGPDDFAGIFFTFEAADSAGGYHSATATLTTRENGVASTIAYEVFSDHVHRVVTNSDFGEGSLRAAIEEINGNPLCGTEIACTVAIGTRNESLVLTPSMPLPAIRKCNVWLFANEDPEFPASVRSVTISGERALWGNGLEVRASCAAGVYGVHIAGLAIHSWPWNGIQLESPEPWAGTYAHTLERVFVGTDATGTIAKPNGSRGINVDSPYDLVSIFSSISSGNTRSGLALWRGQRAYVVGSKFGVGANGQPLGNGASGVFSQGVPLELIDCTVAHNAHFGVALTPGTAGMVAWNAIHSNAGLPVDYGLDDRTPSDDESDGVLNAPRLLDAYYDDARGVTIVKGVVRLRAGTFGGSFGVSFYNAISERGDNTGVLPLAPVAVAAPLEGVEDVEFEAELGVLVPRGSLISAATVGGVTFPEVASEISEAIRVR